MNEPNLITERTPMKYISGLSRLRDKIEEMAPSQEIPIESLERAVIAIEDMIHDELRNWREFN